MADLLPDSRWNHPRYVLKRQLLKLLGAGFVIHDPAGNLVLYVEQKAFKLKEDIRVYADMEKKVQLLTIKARSVIDFSAVYDVIDTSSGQWLGALQRKGWKSIARDEWVVAGPDGKPIGTLIEDQLIFALLRRLLTNLVPQDYDLLVNGVRRVDFKQNFNPFTYHLNVILTENQGVIDPRLALSAAILLAAIEGRQS